MNGRDFGYFSATLIINILADYFLFKPDEILIQNNKGSFLARCLYGMVSLFRIYIPLILFSLANYKIITGKKCNVILKNIFFLFVIRWLFNEFTYEISLFVRVICLNLY